MRVLNLRDKKMKCPYIIVVFSLLKDSAAYFIDIQDGIFPVGKFGNETNYDTHILIF